MFQLSRSATVKLQSVSGRSSGTGFFISDHLVVTCFHVVASFLQLEDGRISGSVYQDIEVLTSLGEVLRADVVSIPTTQDISPVQYDFAFLRLRENGRQTRNKLVFATRETSEELEAGSDVVFSGFPLDASNIVTHRGMISGYTDDKSLISIQAPINKGNSGGALLDDRGAVIGIISMKCGGISSQLATVLNQIRGIRASGSSVSLFGIDQMRVLEELVMTLDIYTSVGIGYARNIEFARRYLETNPSLFV